MVSLMVLEQLEEALHECPFCHKLRAAQQVAKEEIDSNEVTKQTAVFQQGTLGMGLGRIGIGPEIGIERVADHPEDFITYKLTYKCKDCGKEWSKLAVKEVELPKKYVKDEEEKTDYDASREAEDAREEEYSR